MTLTAEQYSGVAARAECLVDAAQVNAALDRMAAELTARLAGKDLLILCVMTGAVVVAGMLLPRLHFPLRLDYIHATRYRGATSGGHLHWLRGPSEAINGEHVLVLDDVLDEGGTLEQVMRACADAGAASVHCAVLVEKDRVHRCEADIVGINVPDRYVFGCGLDYRDYFRNIVGIYAIAPEDI